MWATSVHSSLHDVACRATVGLKYPSPQTAFSLFPLNSSHTLFVLIIRKLPASAKRDQPTATFSSSLWHSAHKSQAKLFFFLSVSLFTWLSVGALFRWGYDWAEKGCMLSVEECGAEWAYLTKWDEKVSYVQLAKREIESFRVGNALWGIALLSVCCGLELSSLRCIFRACTCVPVQALGRTGSFCFYASVALACVLGVGRCTKHALSIVSKSSKAADEWEVCICRPIFYCVSSSNLLPTSWIDSTVGRGPQSKMIPWTWRDSH